MKGQSSDMRGYPPIGGVGSPPKAPFGTITEQVALVQAQ
jgi:hypothetical protein